MICWWQSRKELPLGIPRKQFVLARIRGRRTDFFYGAKLGQLVQKHIRIGEEFKYAKQFTRNWQSGLRTGANRYSTEGR